MAAAVGLNQTSEERVRIELCQPALPGSKFDTPSVLPARPVLWKRIPRAADRSRGPSEMKLVGAAGFEPACPCGRRVLSPLRIPVPPRPRHNSMREWRRRADSNRCIEVLQTSALATWLRRRATMLSGSRRGWSGKRDSNPRPRPWQGRALPLSYSRVTGSLRQRHIVSRRRGPSTQPVASRSAVAASSGGTGLMKNPLPHSKPATLVSLGMISRCQ